MLGSAGKIFDIVKRAAADFPTNLFEVTWNAIIRHGAGTEDGIVEGRQAIDHGDPVQSIGKFGGRDS